MKKVSEFLKELNSHSVYHEPTTSNRFKEETWFDAPWRRHTVGSVNASVGHFKGLQEEIKGNESDHCSCGYEISTECAVMFIPNYSTGIVSGRGTLHRMAIAELEAAGF